VDREIQARCESVVRKAGITGGQTVLDFGCGSGNYTIPAAKAVGPPGKVYAVDRSGSKLQELARRAAHEGLETIIETRETAGELQLGLPSHSIDLVLLYDIFWYFPIGSRLRDLLREIRRLLKPDALLSIFPEHIDVDALQHEIQQAGFNLERRFSTEVVHDAQPQTGQILNFRKSAIGGDGIDYE